METPTTHLLEEILARLPLRSISRFKSVCKTWKWILESPYFRRLFLSVHKYSSSSWSLLWEGREVIGFHGCETWDLPKSPFSFIPHSLRYYRYDAEYLLDESNGLVLILGRDRTLYVGNPVLQQWLRIPSPPDRCNVFGLVTRVDEDDVVLSFKVFGRASSVQTIETSNDELSDIWSVFVYSSETGIWTSRTIHCPCHIIFDYSYLSVNGTLYFIPDEHSQFNQLISYDFYSESDHCRVLQFPDHSSDYKTALTTSRGFVMYIATLSQKEETLLQVWKLSNNETGDESWQILWDICISIIGKHVPMAMHPFDSGVVYLWSQKDRHVVSCDLRTENYRILKDGYNDGHQDFVIDQSVCEESIDEDYFSVSVWLLQFVLPRWMEPVPRPPQTEMIDTTSLLSLMPNKGR